MSGHHTIRTILPPPVKTNSSAAISDARPPGLNPVQTPRFAGTPGMLECGVMANRHCLAVCAGEPASADRIRRNLRPVIRPVFLLNGNRI
jgi:hypothetical protein